MKKEYLIFTFLLFITFSNLTAQDIPNDTIVRKDGTKIIDNFKTITAHKGYLITSKYEISMEKIESINDNDLKKIAIPLNEIDKVISNSMYQKKRKLLNEDDVIWESKTNNHKKKVWVHSRSEQKTVILPNDKLELLELLVEGKCDLYFTIKPSHSINFSLNFGPSMTSGPDNYYYYFKRIGELKSTLFIGTSVEPFSKYGEFVRIKKLNYFDDCPKAKQFIEKEKNFLSCKLLNLLNYITRIVIIKNNSCQHRV